MSEYFNEGQRQLQDEFETRPLADRLQAGIIQAVITPLDAEFIEAQNMFFLATVDDKGQANCSYKGGQKGLVEEKDLRIPNMRGIMMARTKALTLVEPTGDASATKAVKFEKPAAKSAVKLVSADNLDELINLLHNEAKII